MHHCLSDLQEVSGEMQSTTSLQHLSIMESHAVAVAAKTPGKLYHRCQDFPLNYHRLPKSHIHGHITGHTHPSTNKQPTTTNQRLARMASHNQNFTVIPHNAYVMKRPVYSLCFRLLKRRVVLWIFCFNVFILLLLLFHREEVATKIIFMIGKKKSGLSGNVIVPQSSQNVHILQHVCF